MDFDEQLRFIRMRKNMEFEKYINCTNDNQIENQQDNQIDNQQDNQIENQQIDNQQNNQIDHQSDNQIDHQQDNQIDHQQYNQPENQIDHQNDNQTQIQLEINNCVNVDKALQIPEKYRFIIDITDQHTNEYSENDVPEYILEMHRHIYEMVILKNAISLFKYCFDIRQLYPVRNNIFEIDGYFYFLQANDHSKICFQWKELANNIDYI